MSEPKKDDLVVEQVDPETGEKKEIAFNAEQAQAVYDLQMIAHKQQAAYQNQIKQLQQELNLPKKIGFTWDGITYYCPECGGLEKITPTALDNKELLDDECSHCEKALKSTFLQYRIYQYQNSF